MRFVNLLAGLLRCAFVFPFNVPKTAVHKDFREIVQSVHSVLWLRVRYRKLTWMPGKQLL